MLSTYQRMSDSVVAHHGGDLYVGQRLAHTPIQFPYERTLNRVYDHRVPVPAAARIFAMNLNVWRDDPWIQGRHQPAMLDELAKQLEHLALSEDAGEIVFSIRQIAIKHRRPR